MLKQIAYSFAVPVRDRILSINDAKNIADMSEDRFRGYIK